MRLNKKFAAIALTATVALTATAAFAYWTTSGSGSGAATAAAGNSVGLGTGVTVAQDATTPATGLVPGGTAKPVNVKVTNNNPGSVSVGAVTAVITSGWTAAGIPACTAADFTVAGSSAPAGVLASSATSGSLAGITIALNNNPTDNQDACKSASPTLEFSAAAGS